MQISWSTNRSNSLPTASTTVSSPDRGPNYKDLFDKHYSEDAYAQYRGAINWEVAYNAASYLGTVDTGNPAAVMQAWQETLRARRYSYETGFAQTSHSVDLGGLSIEAAREFYFKKLGVNLTVEQTQELMDCNVEMLLRNMSYSTMAWPQRAICFCLGKAPRVPKEAYVAEYMRRGLDLSFALDICRRKR